MEVLTISAISFAADMLFRCASFPRFCDEPSFRIRTGCPEDVTAEYAWADVNDSLGGIQLRVGYKFSRMVLDD
jgi:hypothetical protein